MISDTFHLVNSCGTPTTCWLTFPASWSYQNIPLFDFQMSWPHFLQLKNVFERNGHNIFCSHATSNASDATKNNWINIHEIYQVIYDDLEFSSKFAALVRYIESTFNEVLAHGHRKHGAVDSKNSEILLLAQPLLHSASHALQTHCTRDLSQRILRRATFLRCIFYKFNIVSGFGHSHRYI